MQKSNLYDEKVKNEILEIVLRQTNYTREEGKLKLESNNYNFHKVIKEYMCSEKIEKNEINKKININQQIFKEIRNMMDSGERNKRFTEELKNRINSKE